MEEFSISTLVRLNNRRIISGLTWFLAAGFLIIVRLCVTMEETSFFGESLLEVDGLANPNSLTNNPPSWQRILCELRRTPFNIALPSTATPLPLVDGKLIIKTSKDNIFFIERACNPRPLYRVWCSIESWALHHRNNSLWYVMTAPYIEDPIGIVQEMQKTYENLKIVTLDLDKLFSMTPLAECFASWKRKNTDWPVIQLSDIARAALAWKFWGLDSDTDNICIKDTNPLGNAIGFGDDAFIVNGFFRFSPNHIFIYETMMDMVQNYNPHQWGSLGRLAYTRVLNKFCGENATLRREKGLQACMNVTLLPPKSFYPIHYASVNNLLNNDGGRNFDQDFKDSYAIQFYNKLTMDIAVRVGGGSILDIAAKRYCPLTYKYLSSHSLFF